MTHQEEKDIRTIYSGYLEKPLLDGLIAELKSFLSRHREEGMCFTIPRMENGRLRGHFTLWHSSDNKAGLLAGAVDRKENAKRYPIIRLDERNHKVKMLPDPLKFIFSKGRQKGNPKNQRIINRINVIMSPETINDLSAILDAQHFWFINRNNTRDGASVYSPLANIGNGEPPDLRSELLSGISVQAEMDLKNTDEAGSDGKKRRQEYVISRTIRNSPLTEEIKRRYAFQCQICGIVLGIEANQPYAEVHHIKPLGAPHDGPDTEENMICVCPNCHVLLDYRLVKIDFDSLKKHLRHNIRNEFVEYHNARVSKKNGEEAFVRRDQ